MVLAGDVPVERGTRKSALKAMRRCQEVLANKVSVMMFPEGTRSETDEMLPFKEGAFRLAVDSGVPILPVVVRGTRNALPKHGWRFGKSHAEVRVLEPIETAGLTTKEVPALAERVRNLIMAEREKMILKP
jgi:1-acyl-sn-glycerol-3-phosphate acyltransferase